MSAHVLVTCGPSSAPIDRVRRITNFSTGELGTLLARALTARGLRVTCLRGTGATHPAPPDADVRGFETNDDLVSLLESLREETIHAVFHAAALSDYEVARISSPHAGSGKIPSGQELTLHLRPARKVLSLLRGIFPSARIAGWKYEVDGTREDALEKGRAQLARNGTDLCVVNGPAYGAGFGILIPNTPAVLHHTDKSTLCAWLADWAARG